MKAPNRQSTNLQVVTNVIPDHLLWSLIDWINQINDNALHKENVMYNYEFNPFYNQHN